MLRLVVDSSTLFALERADLIKFLNKTGYEIIIPGSVKEEIVKDSKGILNKVKIEPLRGKSLKKSKFLENIGIGKGEAQCCILANKLKLDFIICDDRKFLRQRYLNKDLEKIKINGFAFFLDIFIKKKIIKDVWEYFNKIIKLNNWERSEVEAANYVFLKEMGY